MRRDSDETSNKALEDQRSVSPESEPSLRESRTCTLSWILCAAFISGAAVMLVEVVGTRVLTPFFGVGLYVWSALLVVTLGSLAVGYYLGGWVADRRSSAALPLELIVAGVGVAMAPALRVPLLRALDGWDLRAGTLVAALILFAPALCAMGMVSTTAVKLAILGSQGTGRPAGLVYAVSTLGSLLGTLLAGFWLVPSFSVSLILWATAGLLIVMGLSGLRRRARIKAAPLLLVPFVLLRLTDIEHGNGPWRVIERRSSLYGNLSVIEDSSRDVPLKLLRADHSIIGAQWENGEPAFSFVHQLEAAVLARSDAEESLLIGLGIGSAVPFLIEQGIQVDVVELDPSVVKLSREHFGFETNGKVFIRDARTFLRRRDAQYDIIIHDTFTGGTTPEHLLSLEVMRDLRIRLRPGGVLVLNLVGTTEGPASGAARAVERTLREAFHHVRLFRDGPAPTTRSSEGERLSNLVFFASDRPITFDQKVLDTLKPSPRRRVLSRMPAWEVTQPLEGGRLITDENNPMTRLGTVVSQRHHAMMRTMYPAEFWLR